LTNNRPIDRGKSWKNSLYRAPESDEWEEIEWGETTDKIPGKIHVCPYPYYAVLICLRFVFVNNFY